MKATGFIKMATLRPATREEYQRFDDPDSEGVVVPRPDSTPFTCDPNVIKRAGAGEGVVHITVMVDDADKGPSEVWMACKWPAVLGVSPSPVGGFLMFDAYDLEAEYASSGKGVLPWGGK
jgi:hypothetical protein